MADVFMMGSIGVGIANILLAFVLLLVYGGVYARSRAPFTAALIAFAAAFLAHNALTVYAYATMMTLIPDALAPYMLGVGALEAGGLGAMLYTATR